MAHACEASSFRGLDSSLWCALLVPLGKSRQPIQHLCHRHEPGRHRLESTPAGRWRTTSAATTRGAHDAGRHPPPRWRRSSASSDTITIGPAWECTCVQGHPPADRHPGAADRGDFRRAARLAITRTPPPAPLAFQEEPKKRLRELHMARRAGRTGASPSTPWSLGALWGLDLSPTSWR